MAFTCQICGQNTERWKRCDEHYVCGGCGKGKDEARLCYYTDGVYCDSCRKEVVDEQIRQFSGDTTFESEVVCPWCGHRHSDSWEYSEGQQECSNCERKFEMSRTVEVTYSTKKL